MEAVGREIIYAHFGDVISPLTDCALRAAAAVYEAMETCRREHENSAQAE